MDCKHIKTKEVEKYESNGCDFRKVIYVYCSTCNTFLYYHY
jgi:hypothetical protein